MEQKKDLIKWRVSNVTMERDTRGISEPIIVANVRGVFNNPMVNAFDPVMRGDVIFADLENRLGAPVTSRYSIERVIFNAPATIIIWSDGVKTVVKCQEGDTYNPETGFALAYLKRLLGNDNTFNKEINKWVGDAKYNTKDSTEEKDHDIYLAYKELYSVVYKNPNKVTKAQLFEAVDKAIGHLEDSIGETK